MRRQYAEKFAQREIEVKRREAAILRDRESLDELIAGKLRSERVTIAEVEAADQFRANSGLEAKEYSAPVLGLIFLRFSEVRFDGGGSAAVKKNPKQE